MSDVKPGVNLRMSLCGFKSAFTHLSSTIEGFISEGLHDNSHKMANDFSLKYRAQMEKLADATD